MRGPINNPGARDEAQAREAELALLLQAEQTLAEGVSRGDRNSIRAYLSLARRKGELRAAGAGGGDGTRRPIQVEEVYPGDPGYPKPGGVAMPYTGQTIRRVVIVHPEMPDDHDDTD